MTISGRRATASSAVPAVAGKRAAISGGVPSRIEIWWPEDKRRYTAVVIGYSKREGRHSVRYEIDDTVESEDLAVERWYRCMSPEEDSALSKRAQKL